MIALKMYLGTIIQLEAGPMIVVLAVLWALLLQVLEFTVTPCNPIGTIKVINTQRLVTLYLSHI